MSAAGTYNFHPKVNFQKHIFEQMASGGFQKPFFFGGSQVPINLGLVTGSGIKTQYNSHVVQMKNLGASGRGLETTIQKNHKIYLPKHMSTIKKII